MFTIWYRIAEDGDLHSVVCNVYVDAQDIWDMFKRNGYHMASKRP